MARNESFFKRLTRLFRSGPSIQRRVKGQNVGSYYDTKLVQGNYGYRAPAPFGFGRENSPFSVLGSYGILDRMARYGEFAEMEYCIAGDTKIAVPGGYKTIKDLADECSNNPEHTFMVYSYDHSKKEIIPAIGKQARLTRIDYAFKVTFNSGKEIIGTSNHRLMRRDGTYCEIGDLKPGDAMMPFYRRSVATDRTEGQHNLYQTIYTIGKENNPYGWTAEHKLLAQHILGRKLKKDEVVHHKNFLAHDNRIENLEVMTATEHRKLHVEILNGNKWNKEKNGEWIEKFKKQHSAWMKANNPAERKDITFERILHWCDTNSFNLYKVSLAFSTDNNTIKRKLLTKGFSTWTDFAMAYSPGWRSESWNNSGTKNPRFRADITFGKICDHYSKGITKKQLSKRLGISVAPIQNRLKEAGYNTWTEFTQHYENHKVASVEYCGEIPLYDLTVDGYKNFATDSVISHNTPEIASAMDIYADETAGGDQHGRSLHVYSDNLQIKRALEELFYDVLNVEFNLRSWTRNLPVKWNTPIPLLDGTAITIKELSDRLKDSNYNEDIWVYSIQDETHKIVPGKVTWCDKNYTSNKIVKVFLDDGSFIETAPEHTFILRNGKTKRADELKHDDSLMPFYTYVSSKENRSHKGRKDSLNGYEKVYNPNTGKYKYTHRMVAEETLLKENGANKKKKGTRNSHDVTHHIDFNKRNNHPDNLVRMDNVEHYIYHSKHAKELLHERPEVVKKRMDGIDRWLRSDKHRDLAREQLKVLQEKGLMRKGWGEYNNSELHTKHNEIRSENKTNFWKDEARRAKAKENMRIKLGDKCISLIINEIKNQGKYVGRYKLIQTLKNNSKFIKEFELANKNSGRNIMRAFNGTTFNNLIMREAGMVYCEFYRSVLPSISGQREYKIASNSRETKLLKNSQQKNGKVLNHKIDRIEIIEEMSDVYCMTVLGPEGQHDRHNFAVCSQKEDGKFDFNGVFLENCKYGDFFLYNEVLPDLGVINAQPIPVNELEREEGYDEEDPYAVRFKWLTRGNIYLENWQVTHMRILGNDLFLPYGTAVLEPARRIWRQLIMMEDAMLVYRVVRSPERRVFYIDIGNIAPNDVPSYMEAAKSTLRSHSVIDRTTGRQDLRYNPLAVDEDYYIPVRGGQSGTKIDTLAGGTHVTATEDVAYIQSKLFAALKVPKPYLNYDENLSSKATLAQEDVRFSRTIGNIQKIVIAEMTKLAMIHLFSKGFDGEDLIDFEIKLSNPSTIAIQQKLELWATKMDIAGTAKETGLVDARWIQRNILDLTDDDVAAITTGLYKDKVVEVQLDKVAFEEEEETQTTTDPFSNSNYGMPGEDIPKGPPGSDASKKQKTGGTDIIIPPGGKKKDAFKTNYKQGSSPIKASPFLTKNKKNRNRRVNTSGRSNNANPDFAAMLNPSKNRSLSDVYDKGFLRNPTKREGLEIDVDGETMTLGEAKSFKPEVFFSKEMHSIFSTLKEHLYREGNTNKMLNEELLIEDTDFMEVDEDDLLISEVLDKDTQNTTAGVVKTLKEVLKNEEKTDDDETIELDLE